MEHKRERKNLRYMFSDAEKLVLAGSLANKQQELSRLEDQKKSINSEYGSRISIAKEHINMSADKLASGYEMRDIECSVEFHVPERNKKTITRYDNGEEWVEPMTDYDYNLFTQYEEDHKEDEAENFVNDEVVTETLEEKADAEQEWNQIVADAKQEAQADGEEIAKQLGGGSKKKNRKEPVIHEIPAEGEAVAGDTVAEMEAQYGEAEGGAKVF